MSHDHKEFTDANREAWDEKAKSYDSKPWQQKVASQVSNALRDHAAWLGANWSDGSDGKECRLLDYACGTGSVTRALSPHITSATGLDISTQMLSQYTSLLNQSHPNLPLTTAVADLVSSSPQPSISDQEFYGFNIAGIALGFHHFADPKGCVQRIGERLAKDGVLFVVDWLPADNLDDPHAHLHGHGHGHGQAQEETEEWKKMKKTVKHNGFTEEQMKEIFEGNGFTDFGFEVLDEGFEMQMNGKTVLKRGFLAKGKKA